RFDCDWSSDVCSSDLVERADRVVEPRSLGLRNRRAARRLDRAGDGLELPLQDAKERRLPAAVGTEYGESRAAPELERDVAQRRRSEERRVGKEGRPRG